MTQKSIAPLLSPAARPATTDEGSCSASEARGASGGGCGGSCGNHDCGDDGGAHGNDGGGGGGVGGGGGFGGALTRSEVARMSATSMPHMRSAARLAVSCAGERAATAAFIGAAAPLSPRYAAPASPVPKVPPPAESASATLTARVISTCARHAAGLLERDVTPRLGLPPTAEMALAASASSNLRPPEKSAPRTCSASNACPSTSPINSNAPRLFFSSRKPLAPIGIKSPAVKTPRAALGSASRRPGCRWRR